MIGNINCMMRKNIYCMMGNINCMVDKINCMMDNINCMIGNINNMIGIISVSICVSADPCQNGGTCVPRLPMWLSGGVQGPAL